MSVKAFLLKRIVALGTWFLALPLVGCGGQATDELVYVGSETPYVTLYHTLDEETFTPIDSLVRGTEVLLQGGYSKRDTLLSIMHDDQRYWVKSTAIAREKNQIVQEPTVRMMRSASIISDTLTSKICGLAERDSVYPVVGYDYLRLDGTVNRYAIANSDTGFVYAKYTASRNSQLITHNSQLTIHASVRDLFGGGKATDCEFLPFDKPTFADNPMPEACYSLYLNISPNVIGKIDEYIALAKQTKINTFVIDIKDNECPGYKAETMALYSPTNYKWAGKNKEAMYKYAVERLHEEGFYVVGRITCFKDTYFVKDNPKSAITNRSNGEPFFHNKAFWPSAFDRNVWQFNVELAKEAVRKFGFNEINFDYVRFPDKIQKVENQIDYHNRYNESKVQAIQRFVQYACDEIHAVGAYVSIDVFGETTNKGYTTPYGQYWPAISNVADVICGMPYPDHFANGYGGIEKPWNNPYQTLLTWGRKAAARQAETPTPAKVRTWIQAYPVMTYVDSLGIKYNAAEVAEEIRGLYDAGITDGYITWLSSSNIKRYQMLAPAFERDYFEEQKQN